MTDPSPVDGRSMPTHKLALTRTECAQSPGVSSRTVDQLIAGRRDDENTFAEDRSATPSPRSECSHRGAQRQGRWRNDLIKKPAVRSASVDC